MKTNLLVISQVNRTLQAPKPATEPENDRPLAAAVSGSGCPRGPWRSIKTRAGHRVTILLATALVLIAMMIHATNSAGQDGTVNFNTHASGVNAPVRDTDGTTLLSGAAFRAQLYAGPHGSIESALHAVGTPVAFLTGTSAGYVNGGTVTVTGIAGNTQAAIQMRVWRRPTGRPMSKPLLPGARPGDPSSSR